MATEYTRQWIQFFTGCGIPEEVAATYGLIFNENRIQKNMLLDLNKEYLRDMGITVMGDVIAILRHAKVVHDKYIRDQILSESEEKSLPETVVVNDGSPNVKRSTPMKRMLEHYTRKCEVSDGGVTQAKVQIRIENESNLVNVPKKLAHRIGVQTQNQSARKKIEAPSMKDELTPGKLEVPVSKTRRVLPENEGGYTIKIPTGTTERSKKLLEKAKLKQCKTVFDRLGESSVSSTSDVTTSTGTLSRKGSKEKNQTSVFSRLGEKSPLVTSTSSNGEFLEQLPYRGILKPESRKLTLKTKDFGGGNKCTMRADDEFHLAKSVKKIDLLKERLGVGGKGKPVGTEGSKPNRVKITAKFDDSKTEVHSLSNRFKVLPGESSAEKKNVLDGLGSFRSEGIRGKVTSTTQLPERKERGLKRRLENYDTNPDATEVTQSKKVRFGGTTQRLIPGNATEPKTPPKKYRNLTMVIGDETSEKTTVLGLMTAGDRNKQKLNLKERIGGGPLLSRLGRTAADLRRKRSLKLVNRLKKAPVSIHDRLG